MEDWRAALITAAVANGYRDPKKRQKPYQPADFMPRHTGPPVKEQTWEEQFRLLGMWSRAVDAKFSGK